MKGKISQHKQKKTKKRENVKNIGSISWYYLIWQQLCEYCGHTALHGYQYVTEPDRHIIERILWICVHCCAITGASLMIHSTWRRYEASPTTTAVESTHYPVWNVPFPAVTICDPNQIQASKAKKLAKKLSGGNKTIENTLFDDTKHLVQLLKHGTVPTNATRLHGYLSRTGLSIEQIMEELSPNCLDFLVMCRWKGENIPCSSLFQRTKSDNGFCCSFNYVPSCYDNNCSYTSMSVPQFVTSAGYRYGLRVMIKYDLKERHGAAIATSAMRVLLHSWFDYPGQWAAAEALVRRHSHTFFRVTAESTYATEGLQNLDLRKRGCVFSKSKKMDLYSQDNCLVKCRHDHVIRLCGCQPYYYPGTVQKRQCDLSDVDCLDRYKGLLSRLRPSVKVLGLEADARDAMECMCSPPCHELTYRYSATSGDLLLDKHNYDVNDFLHSENYSLFYIFFGRMTGTRYRRDVLFSWDNMISNAGGLCGLFMGFSIISIVELVYFFTIRLYFMVRRGERIIKKRRVINRIHDLSNLAVLPGANIKPHASRVIWSDKSFEENQNYPNEYYP